MKSELKITSAAGVLGALPVLLEMLQGDGSMSDNMMMALIGCVTAMVVGYNIARGIAKVEVRNGSATPATGMKSTEFKLSAGAAGLGATPVLIDMLKGGGEAMPDKLKMALMFSITAIALSYSLSRGLAKTQTRDAPPAA
jgi:hypothetical protein